MKYLLLLIVFAGCTIVPKKKISEYECVIFNFDGVYARVKGYYASKKEAKHDVEIVRKRLVDQNIIPNNTRVECEKTSD